MTPDQLEIEIRHLATKEELQKLRVELILWIIGTQFFATCIVLGAMSFSFSISSHENQNRTRLSADPRPQP
jgi:hypothetical protein